MQENDMARSALQILHFGDFGEIDGAKKEEEQSNTGQMEYVKSCLLVAPQHPVVIIILKGTTPSSIQKQ